MRILILGGDGYLGWPMAMHFAKRGHDVTVVDTASGSAPYSTSSCLVLTLYPTCDSTVLNPFTSLTISFLFLSSKCFDSNNIGNFFSKNILFVSRFTNNSPKFGNFSFINDNSSALLYFLFLIYCKY